MQKYMNKDLKINKIQNLKGFKLPHNFRGKPAWIAQLWWLVQDTIFRYSPQCLYGWRRFLLRLFGAQIGKKVIIRPTVKVTYPWKLIIGDYSWIGDEVTLYTLGEIEIEDNVVISQKSYICTASHDHTSQNFDIFNKKVIIKTKVWLATDVFVAPGVTIEKGVVVGARSSVFKNLPEMMICYGSPAEPKKRRDI